MKSWVTEENMKQSFEILYISAFSQVLWSQLKINLQIFFCVFRSEKIWQKLMELSTLFPLKTCEPGDDISWVYFINPLADLLIDWLLRAESVLRS
jgi:hypothetical protein